MYILDYFQFHYNVIALSNTYLQAQDCPFYHSMIHITHLYYDESCKHQMNAESIPSRYKTLRSDYTYLKKSINHRYRFNR